MAKIIEIQKPEFKKINTLEDGTVLISIKPLENGFGTTIGNALRRTLLSTLPGAAATAIRIEGISNEFSSIPGVTEDVIDIVLNVKSIYFKAHTEDATFRREVKLAAQGPCKVTAGMIDVPSEIEILNPDLEICTLGEDGSINMTIIVEVGRGYKQAVENKKSDDSIDTIHIDSMFTPVRSASYKVLPCRVGQNINFDELELSIKTNGTETPEKVLAVSAKILYDQLYEIMEWANNKTGEQDSYIKSTEKKIEEKEKTSIDDLSLSVRSINCLKRAGIKYLEDITNKTEEEMMNVKNLGAKSLVEIKEKLEEKGLSFKSKSE